MFQFDQNKVGFNGSWSVGFLRTAPVLSSSPVGYPVSSSACRSSALRSLQLSPFGMGNEILHSLKLTFSPLKNGGFPIEISFSVYFQGQNCC